MYLSHAQYRSQSCNARREFVHSTLRMSFLVFVREGYNVLFYRHVQYQTHPFIFAQLCYLLYLTSYKINGQLSANNPMLIFVQLFPSKSEKAQQFHFLDLITWKGRKTNLFCRVHRCWELKADLKCCSRKYKKDNKTLFYTHDTKINERVIK